jgi:ketosteroid isomerase-like protein/TolB-like protein
MPRRSLLVAGSAAAAVGLGWLARRWLPGVIDRIAAKPGAPQAAPGGGPLVLGVMAVHSRGQVPDWMNDFTRDGLNTVLSKNPGLLVYSRQKIDFLSEKRGLREMEVAEQLGIAKMIAASISEVDSRFTLDVQIIDIGTGLIEGSHEVTGSEKQLIEMQNEAAIDVMRSLGVPVDAAELTQFLARRTNDRLDDYRLLTESMGGPGEGSPPGTDPKSEMRIPWLGPFMPRSAYASEADQEAIRELLERYRAALESKDVGQVEVLHVDLPDPTRDALRRYFQNAEHLQVQFSKLDIVVEGDEALATLTRSDDFIDVRSGLPVHLEMRVSSVLARQNGAWKIRGLSHPS